MNSETLKALIEAILYVSPEPVTLEMLAQALAPEERDRIKGALFELINDYAWPQHGIQIRAVAGGWKFSSKPEHHEVLRGFVKSLKPPIRLSKPALEALAVIAYRQPVTLPEMNEIRGVDCGGVIHTLLEKKLVVTAGRKNVVGRPILYRTSRDFLVHFGLKDVGDLPSLREFEEMARQALGSEAIAADEFPAGSGAEVSGTRAEDATDAGAGKGVRDSEEAPADGAQQPAAEGTATEPFASKEP
jgi:segregation and condensation protein B